MHILDKFCFHCIDLMFLWIVVCTLGRRCKTQPAAPRGHTICKHTTARQWRLLYTTKYSTSVQNSVWCEQHCVARAVNEVSQSPVSGRSETRDIEWWWHPNECLASKWFSWWSQCYGWKDWVVKRWNIKLISLRLDSTLVVELMISIWQQSVYLCDESFYFRSVRCSSTFRCLSLGCECFKSRSWGDFVHGSLSIFSVLWFWISESCVVSNKPIFIVILVPQEKDSVGIMLMEFSIYSNYITVSIKIFRIM